LGDSKGILSAASRVDKSDEMTVETMGDPMAASRDARMVVTMVVVLVSRLAVMKDKIKVASRINTWVVKTVND
jgi:hypothetical protein